MNRSILPALLLLAGCYEATVRVRPSSALITPAEGLPTAPPARVKVRPWPIPATRVQISAPGHRATEIKVRWRLGASVGRGREIEVFLVEEHGHAGEVEVEVSE